MRCASEHNCWTAYNDAVLARACHLQPQMHDLCAYETTPQHTLSRLVGMLTGLVGERHGVVWPSSCRRE
jgi:hypothetical protein